MYAYFLCSHFVCSRTFLTNIKKHSHNIFNIHNSFIFRSARKSGWTKRKKHGACGCVCVCESERERERKTHAQQTKQTTTTQPPKKIKCCILWTVLVYIIKIGFILCAFWSFLISFVRGKLLRLFCCR